MTFNNYILLWIIAQSQSKDLKTLKPKVHFAGSKNPYVPPPPADYTVLIICLVVLFLLLYFVSFCLKCAYDRNNNYLMMNLPESEKKIYAAILAIEREHDKR